MKTITILSPKPRALKRASRCWGIFWRSALSLSSQWLVGWWLNDLSHVSWSFLTICSVICLSAICPTTSNLSRLFTYCFVSELTNSQWIVGWWLCNLSHVFWSFLTLNDAGYYRNNDTTQIYKNSTVLKIVVGKWYEQKRNITKQLLVFTHFFKLV